MNPSVIIRAQLRVIRADCADCKIWVAQAGGVLAAGKMIRLQQLRVQVVMGHGFGLNPFMAEIMVGAAFENILPGLECVGPLKAAFDTVTKEALDISQGYFALPTNPGLSVTFDDEKLLAIGFDGVFGFDRNCDFSDPQTHLRIRVFF